MATTDIGRAVPLLQGEYDPAQTYELNDIVSLNGSLYWHYSHEVTTNVAPQATSTWKIVLSLTDAEAYIARAETAAEEAESAKDDAVTAKTAAETASTTATGASEAATAAKDDAVTARNAAQTAETGAVEAKNAAVSAKEAAQSAASSAGTSATNASNSAGTAEYYAENAETAAETATTKASEASASASTASSAATTATGAKTAAETAASTATTKAGEASTSATSAASSAAAAQAVKDSIPEDYSELSEDVGELKTQLNSLLQKSVKFVNGYSVNSADGSFVSNDNYSYAEIKIATVAGTTLKGFTRSQKSTNTGLAFYDDSGEYISGFTNPKSGTYKWNIEGQIPDNAVLVRVSCLTSDKNVFSMEYSWDKTFDDIENTIASMSDIKNTVTANKAETEETFEQIIDGINETFTVSTIATNRFPCTLIDGEYYTFTNNTNNTCTLYIYKDNGDRETISGVLLIGQSISFKVNGTDYVGVGSYANGTGTFNLTNSYTLKGIGDNPILALSDNTLRARTFNASYHTGADNFKAKCKQFASLMYGEVDPDATPVNAPADCESFLFFTDPHTMGPRTTGEVNTWENRNIEIITQIQKYYNSTPTTFCLCGGDWLLAQDLPDDACYKLGYIDGFMKSMFKDCYMLVGNHDTNYQGRKDSESETYTTRLSNQSIVDLWYRREGKAYYKFNGANSVFYCIDTGTEAQSLSDFNDYGMMECKWFANSLLTETNAHIVIGTHILYQSTPGSSSLNPIISKILDIAQAYNGKDSITLDSDTFDYSNATGKIELVIAGHSHADYNGIVNGIPCVLTIDAGKQTNYPSFDLMLIDYDNSKLNCVRVGYGSDRVISLTDGQLIT